MTCLFFSAGESSGDIHGSNLIRALRELDPSITCEGLGGQHMAGAGMEVRYDLASHALMGFTEVVKSISMIRKLYKETVAYLEESRPDALVLIDFPGFNMRLAAKAKELGIPVVYYISPQVWAWRKGRIHTLARTVDKMLVILPFEKPMYDEAGLACRYVGHPLVDHIQEVPIEGTFEGERVIGILPGSREQEIARILPVMLDVAQGIRERYPDARFVAPCVNPSRWEQVTELAGDFPLEVVLGQSYEVLHASRFCMVASGTATVETALFSVPMVVLYRTTTVTYWLARMLAKVNAIALVNILAGKHIVPEYIQGEANAQLILPKALELIEDSPARATMLEDLNRVREELGVGGASAIVAEEILAVAGGRTHVG